MDRHSKGSRRSRRWTVGLIVSASVWACDASPDPGTPAPEPPLRGASLVVGTAVDQWSLLSVPRGGGTADVHSLADPARVLTTGVAELPASEGAYVLSDGIVVLHGTDGAAYTYDPASDALVRAGELDADAAWTGHATVGVFWSPAGSVLEISREGVWRYGLDRPLHWAAPVDGGVLAVLDREPGERVAWLLRREEEEPAEAAEIAAGVPGLVTAWGRRIVLTEPAAGGLVVLTVAPIEQAGEVSLSGAVIGLASSPSTHEVYVILDDPPRLQSVNRFNLTASTVRTFERPPEEVRPGLFGDAILVGDGTTVHLVPVGPGDPGRVSSEWRSDLPLGLPGGSVLVGGDAGVEIVDPGRGTSTVLDENGLDRWWLAVPWSPAEAPVTTDRVAGEAVVTDAGEPSEPEADSALLAERAAVAPGLRDSRSAREDPAGVPAGFYAIVGSARQPEGMRDLITSLSDAGFATQLQNYPDEAGRVWYRGLVGPYRSRSEAEAAARQLLRERRLEAWVTEIGASSRPEEPSV